MKYKHSDETKKKIGDGNRGKKRTEEQKQANRLGHLGKTPWNKGLTKKTDKRVLKYANGLIGHCLTEETKKKQKISKEQLKKAIEKATDEWASFIQKRLN